MRLLLAGCFALALSAAPPDAADCVACHDQVNLDKFRKLTHGGLACIKCHTAIKELPHPEKLPPVQCVRCHDHQGQDYAKSVHGVARMQGKDHAATCSSCHGKAHDIVAKSNPASRVAKVNMDATCGKCHTKEHLNRLTTQLVKRKGRMNLEPGLLKK
jgi:hypothetical protein